MTSALGPFRRVCASCRAQFLGRSSDNLCSLECIDETHQELIARQWEFKTLNEEVEVLHEKLFRVQRRIESRLKQLRSLGNRWSLALRAGELARIREIRWKEDTTSAALGRLNRILRKVDREALPAERRLFKLGQVIRKIKKLLGAHGQ